MFKTFTSHLFYKIGLLVLLFSILLIATVFFIVDYYYTEQDSLYITHELYFYSELVEQWDFVNNPSGVRTDANNLGFSVGIYSDVDSSLVWFYPDTVFAKGYISDADSENLGPRYDIEIPFVDYTPTLNHKYTGDLYPRLLEQYAASIAATTYNANIKYWENAASGCLTFMEITEKNRGNFLGYRDVENCVIINEKNYK